MQKHTTNLRSGDWAYIESVYRPKGIATSLVVRTLISNFVDNLKKKEGNGESVDVQVNL